MTSRDYPEAERTSHVVFAHLVAHNQFDLALCLAVWQSQTYRHDECVLEYLQGSINNVYEWLARFFPERVPDWALAIERGMAQGAGVELSPPGRA